MSWHKINKHKSWEGGLGFTGRGLGLVKGPSPGASGIDASTFALQALLCRLQVQGRLA